MRKLLEKIFYSRLFEDIRLTHFRDGYNLGEFEASQQIHFKLSDKEEDELKMWESTHDCHVNAKRGANTNYIFAYAGGIGMTTKIQCNLCKETEDITDYDMW
jgi:hypothetical protein